MQQGRLRYQCISQYIWHISKHFSLEDVYELFCAVSQAYDAIIKRTKVNTDLPYPYHIRPRIVPFCFKRTSPDLNKYSSAVKINLFQLF